ncbi:MAG: hypothetical protein P8Q48_05295 [Paracoccaceae bacterium]|nr:hypothetical protein [Paracoccaceae bacterium]MDG1369644.1 hypothetical protein [Paracoccaceae bacterium]
MIAAEVRATEKVEEAQLLASALETAEIAAARVDAAGEVTWCSAAMDRLP